MTEPTRDPTRVGKRYKKVNINLPPEEYELLVKAKAEEELRRKQPISLSSYARQLLLEALAKKKR